MLKTNIAGIEFKNPVIAASGTFGFGREFSKYIDLSRLGGIASKGVTLKEKPGNSGIRVWETPSGLMNSIGLQNPSVATFIEKDLDYMLGLGTEVLINLGGNTLEDYVEGAKLIENTDAKIIELNISCPNIEEGGKSFGMVCNDAVTVLRAVKEVSTKKIFVKLTPNSGELVDVAVACEREGADAISMVNTFNALAIDIYRRKPVFNNITAGLSGPAIKPIALRMVRDVAKAVNIPIIGMGGICDYKDAIEFIMAGATAVEVGTYNFVNTHAMIDIIDGMEEFMKEQKISLLEEIRGII